MIMRVEGYCISLRFPSAGAVQQAWKNAHKAPIVERGKLGPMHAVQALAVRIIIRSVPLAKIEYSSFIPQVIDRLKPTFFAAGLPVLVAVAVLGPAIGCRNRQTNVSATQHLDFNQDVQPILASHCFSCHGPDPEMRKAGLRLDLEKSAFKKRPGHPDAIVPFHPEKSELIKRIESH